MVQTRSQARMAAGAVEASSSDMAAPAGVNSSSMARPSDLSPSNTVALIADQGIPAAANQSDAPKGPEPPTGPKKSGTRKWARKNGNGNSGSRDDDSETHGDENSRGINLKLPPMHKLEDIFEDMAQKASELGFRTASTYLKGRKIRVATMCSGTESPILALEMFEKALPKFGCNLGFTHVFSAEIVPYKQAYIERNFRTAIIFRDILEIATLKEATTAYGADVAVPERGEVDLLVAGFACVDFSNMNRHRRGLDGTLAAPKATQKDSKSGPVTPRGESGDTLFAILAYAAEKRPPLIILENIMNAPWAEIQKEWEAIGYASRFIVMDAKDYYISHTRQRKYMLCIDKTAYGKAEDAVTQWMDKAASLQRWASSSVEEFLLADDDKRLSDAISELTASTVHERPRKEVQWCRTEIRHALYRQEFRLGSARPATQWSSKGTSTMQDYAMIPWTNGQVNRLKDGLDLTWLMAALYHYDPAYKPLYVDLSQNVDRYRHKTGVTLGITGCLTPSGMPYSTARGGPIVGWESLSLQGIPIERLLLTRENQRQLQDLAGNAMTSTVVGAAIMSALIVAHEAIPRSGHGSMEVVDPRTVARLFQSDHLSSKTSISFATLKTSVTAPQFRLYASSSAQHCACEGQDRINPSTVKTYKCKDCLFSACEQCAGAPRHNFRHLRASEQLCRAQPAGFREHVKDFLPMRLQLSGEIETAFLGVEDRFGASTTGELELWSAFQDAVGPAFREEYRFSSTKRFKNWTICYEGRVSRLELELGEMTAQWLLYVKVDPKLPGNAPLRKTLENPIGRMLASPRDLLRGLWQLRIPLTRNFEVEIKGCGVAYPSWRARYGLIQALHHKVQSAVKVTVAENTGPPGLDIDGVYTLLPDCGTATNNLHRRTSGGSGEPKYLFLDPHRVGPPGDDQFVFASTHNRLRYGEHRLIDASVGTITANQTVKDPNDVDEGTTYWRPNNTPGPQTVECTVTGEWIDAEVALVAVSSQIATCAPLQTSLIVSDVTAPGCQDANIVALACELDLSPEELPDWPVTWTEVDKANEGAAFAKMAWIIEQVRGLEGFEKKWRDIHDLHQGDDTPCPTCCPRKPTIRWRLEAKSRKSTMVPYEDAAEAGPYERGLKARPSPTTIRIKSSDNKAQLEISLNVITLHHRARARLTGREVDAGREIRASWMLNTCYDATRPPTLPKLTVPDNLHDRPLQHVFRYSTAVPQFRLRPDQERSLAWMIGQESDDARPFPEEEVEESIVGPVRWHLQARAVSPRLVRGGVLADKVGYGKTVTTLALIDAQQADLVLEPEYGRFELKATLIMAPLSLIGQWEQEIEAFLGADCKVLVISSIANLRKATISDFQTADIVLVSHTLMANGNYLQRMAWFAARPEAPTSLSTRALTAWLHDTDQRIKEHVEELKNTTSFTDFKDILEKRLSDAEKDEDLIGRAASKRLKGQAYQKSKAKGNVPDKSKGTANANAADQSQDQAKAKAPTDPFRLSRAKDPSSLTGPLLHMFIFARIVLDEYTYVSEKDTASLKLLQTDRRWVLSGTPNLDNFAGANDLAALVGVHLGSDDGSRGLLKGQSMAPSKDKTSAELFHSFAEAQSSDWHERRHALAQEFLDQFARQNVAEIGHIPLESFYKATRQHCAERAIYLELQTQLYGQDMQLVKGQGSTVENDYVNRLNEMIASSTSPEEALLKRCSVFMVKNSDGSPATVDVLRRITRIRLHEFKRHRCNLQKELAEAAAMKQHCGVRDKQYQAWLHLVEQNEYGDHTARDAMLSFINASVHDLGPPRQAPVTDKDVSNLREKKDKLHSMAVEFVARMRMVRFLAQVKDFKDWSGPNGRETIEVSPCCCCQKQFQLLDDVLLLAVCGHTLCQDCLKSPTRGDTCAYEGCDGPSLEYHALDMQDLIGRRTTIAGPTHFGSKIADLVNQIELITAANPDDQILLFVQYEHIRKVIGKAFDAANIGFETITGAEGHAATAEAKALKAFKEKAVPGVQRKSVLMLNASSSCAAGHNITNANHVIFVSPFLAGNQHDYDQLYEQAIGRAKRFGQKKPVYVYHFVCLKSIDVNLIEDASGKKVVVRPDGSDELDLKERDELADEEAARENGTVRFQAHRARVTDDGAEEPAVDEETMEAARVVERLETEWKGKGKALEGPAENENAESMGVDEAGGR